MLCFNSLPLSLSIWVTITNITYWVSYKQQKFISKSSGGWKMQDQGAHMVMFGEGPLLGL